jgi:hypothetical protein
MKLIHTASRGYPRLINYICDRCLLVLYAKSSSTVDGHVVSKVIIEESIPLSTTRHTEDSKRLGLRRPLLIGGTIAVVIIGAAGYYFMITGAFKLFSSTQTRPQQVSVAQPPLPKPPAPSNPPAQATPTAQRLQPRHYRRLSTPAASQNHPQRPTSSSRKSTSTRKLRM